MTIEASDNFAIEFDTLVKQQYQQEMQLRETVRLKTGVVGATHRFPIMNRGAATPRLPQTDVTPMGIAHSYATATITDWNAADYSDIYDLSKLKFDEKMELVGIATKAMGRRLDQMIIDAMDTTAYATQVAITEGGGGSSVGLNKEKFAKAGQLMTDNGVPQSDRYMGISATALYQAMQQTDMTSSDFVGLITPLLSGQLKTYMGFNIKIIGSMDEGGLPLATNTRNCFAWHKQAVGLAIGLDIRTELNYIPEKTSTLVNAIFSAGAVTIDSDGVIDVLTYEA